MTEHLRELQRLLYKAITAPEGVRCAAADARGSSRAGGVDEVIVGDERLGPLERIAIYADAYFYRLLECLKDDFPGVAAVIGADQFKELIRAYLAAYPPVHNSIAYAGRFLPDFIEGSQDLQQWPFLGELARLEWMLIEVFQAPDAAVLKTEELRAIAPERWPAMRLRTPPALRVIDCRWPVASVLRAIRDGSDWQAPEPARQSVMVWRLDAVVYYRAIGVAERAALSLLAQGTSFAAVCQAIAANCAQHEAVTEINRLLEHWVADGCLVLEGEKAAPQARPAAKRRRNRRHK